MSYRGKKRSKSLLLSPGLRPCSPMCMLSQVSKLPCLTIPIRLVCLQADRKPTKQNSCRRQYKMSLQRRLLTVTSDLPGTCPMAYCPPGRGSLRSSKPRALPPVTQGSALQAPERLWFIFLQRIMRKGRMSVLWRGSVQNINQKNPLERMEGCALMSCFRLGLIRASS